MVKLNSELTITMDTKSNIIGNFGVEQLDKQGIMKDMLYNILVTDDTDIASRIVKNNNVILWGNNAKGKYTIENTITLDNCIEILDSAVRSTGIKIVVLDKVLMRNDINSTKDIVKLVKHIRVWAKKEGVTIISILNIASGIICRSYAKKGINSFKNFLNNFFSSIIQGFDYTILLGENNKVLMMNEL